MIYSFKGEIIMANENNNSSEFSFVGCLLGVWYILAVIYLRILAFIPWMISGLLALLSIIGARRSVEIFKHSWTILVGNQDDIYCDYNNAPRANLVWRCTLGPVLA